MDDKVLTQQNESAPRIDETTLNNLSEFIISLIQALLRTGYYTPEHPESQKAKEGLYSMFQALALQKGELTFLVRDTGPKKQMSVEGVRSKPFDLGDLMPLGMAELYDEKLMLFVERKELISLTLKQKMESEEFYNFVDIMSKPILTDIQDTHKRDRFVSYLHDKGIKHVSFVFNADLIRMERRIPWRAWIAISRLRKDITMIPILRNLDQEDLKEVEKEVVSDVMRPLEDPKLSLLTLVNTDLINSKVMKEKEIEENIIASLSDTVLFATVEEFIDSYSHLKTLVNQRTYEAKLQRILEGFKTKLKESEKEESEILLEKFYRNGMISFDELTPSLKEKITLKRHLKTFLNDPDTFLTLFDHMDDEKQYCSIIKTVAGFVPLLIERGRFQELSEILLILKRHGKEGTVRSSQAVIVLEQIGSSDVPLKLKNRFMSEKKEIRQALYPIFVNLQTYMTAHLMAVIEETGDKWVRKNAIDLLLQMAPLGHSYLQQALETERLEGQIVADVIRALATIQNKDVKQKMASVVEEYCQHQNPEVRELVIILLAEAQGINAEDMILGALSDSSLEVRKAAIKYLGIIKSKKALSVFTEILKNAMQSPSKDTEQLENQTYWALGCMDNLLTDNNETAEHILLETLEQRGQTGTFSRLFRGKGNALSDEAMCVICESLERIGTEISESMLTELAKNKNKSWGVKAQQALETIKKRHTTPPSIQPSLSGPLHDAVADSDS